MAVIPDLIHPQYFSISRTNLYEEKSASFSLGVVSMATIVHGVDHYLTNRNTSQPAPMHRKNAHTAKNTSAKTK